MTETTEKKKTPVYAIIRCRHLREVYSFPTSDLFHLFCQATQTADMWDVIGGDIKHAGYRTVDQYIKSNNVIGES